MITPDFIGRYLDDVKNDKLIASIIATLNAGNIIMDIGVSQEETQEKEDIFLGHHSIVTEADIESQELILNYISNQFPHAWFITEENPTKKFTNKVLSKDNSLNQYHKLVFGIDPLDGTSQYQNRLYEWGISVGVMEDLEHTIGVIYSPSIRYGCLVYGSKSKGVFLAEMGLGAKEARVSEVKKDEDILINFGVDILLDPKFNRFSNEVADTYRTTTSNGSCALGLALVASGKIDAFVQPPQRVWDWFGGYPLVEEAGGKMQFYRMENGKIFLIDKPQLEDYNPESKNLGFIAGNSELVGTLSNKLVHTYRKT